MSKNNVTANAGQSRRHLLVGSLAVAASAGAAAATHAGNAAPMKADHTAARRTNMITTKDGTQISYKDWGSGPNTVVFSHGWPLSADAWEDQMMYLASNGYRCIAHDRRGHGRSSQPWEGNNYDTFAADLDTLVTTLDLKNATFIGHSMGGGEVARYLGKFGSARASKAVLIAAVTPLMLKTDNNPEGTPMSAFDGIRAGLQADRAQFYKDLTTPFFGFNRTGIKDSQGRRDTFTALGMQSSLRSSYECVKQFSETDFTQDLKKMTLPTLVIHGDDDQIVPIAPSAIAASKILKNARLEVYKGGSHAIPQMNKDKLNTDLLAFLKQV
ncbi:alpha/beta hydrolase [Polaromonas sp.]|uniref:alpha/beta fold hydrolase n=1 Tax=Polaromonas sp. TaxID=1869339 RepID=UPI0017F7FE80|nr:alpha/beta hydrolase [Polaromonas sp.]NMM05543.1 alpha/beta hydrolase [Polaromonas sp.]